MVQVDVNLMAVVVAAIAQMAIGFFWYSPAFGFGKQWMGYLNITEADMKKNSGNNMMYAWMAVVSLVTSYVLAHFVNYTDSTTVAAGLQTGFWLWLGFVVTFGAGAVLFEGRPRGLFYLNMGYQLVSLCVMGAILAVWG